MSAQRVRTIVARLSAVGRSTIVEIALKGLAALLGVLEDFATQEELSQICDELSAVDDLVRRVTESYLRAQEPTLGRRKIEALAKRLESIATVQDSIKKFRPGTADVIRQLRGKLSEVRADLSAELGLSTYDAIYTTHSNIIDYLHSSRGVKDEEQSEGIPGSESGTQDVDPLETLPRVAASFDSKDNTAVPCFEGTRTGVLGVIHNWIEDASPSTPRMFWLSGAAGMGKSTIAQTIAEDAHANGTLAASFFFSRSGTARSNGELLLPSIAYQMSKFPPFKDSYRISLRQMLSDNPVAVRQHLRLQLRSLLYSPLANVKIEHPAVIVIDALDECSSIDLVEDMLLLLSQGLSQLPRAFRIFVTSRPAYQISAKLDAMVKDLLVDRLILHDIEKTLVRADIVLYLRHHLRIIAQERVKNLKWPEEEQLQILADNSKELFVFASMAITFIRTSTNPKRRFGLLLQPLPGTMHGQTAMLDALYTQILVESHRGFVSPSDDTHFSKVLASIVLLRDQLSALSVSHLLQIPLDDVLAALHLLQSVLLVPDQYTERVRIIHPSFTEFITNSDRCKDPYFFIDPLHHHHRLALSSISCMIRQLKRDICRLGPLSRTNTEVEGLEDRLKQFVPPSLSYSCLHWAHHVARCSAFITIDDPLTVSIRNFCEVKLLYWLEVLSLLGSLQTAVKSLDALLVWHRSAKYKDTRVIGLLEDCAQLISQYFHPISVDSSQVYHTAMAFAPSCPLRSTHSAGVRDSVCVLRGRDDYWVDTLHIFRAEPAISAITGACFSPDGFLIASSDTSGTLRLWDALSGTLIHVDRDSPAMLYRESLHVSTYFFAVQFSPNGKMLVQFGDGHLRVLNIDPWETLLEQHYDEDQTLPFSFSPDGILLAVGRSDGIDVWNFSRRQITKRLQESHDIAALAFSPLGLRGRYPLAYVSLDRDGLQPSGLPDFQVWTRNMADEESPPNLLQELVGKATLSTWYKDSVSVHYAAHGDRLIVLFGYASYGDILDASTGECVFSLQTVHLLTISPDSTCITTLTELRDATDPRDNFASRKHLWKMEMRNARDGLLAEMSFLGTRSFSAKQHVLALSRDGKVYLEEPMKSARGYELRLLRVPKIAVSPPIPSTSQGSESSSPPALDIPKPRHRIAHMLSKRGLFRKSAQPTIQQRLEEQGQSHWMTNSFSFSPDGALCVYLIGSPVVAEVWDFPHAHLLWKKTLTKVDASKTRVTVSCAPDNVHFILLYRPLDYRATPFRIECWNAKTQQLFQTGHWLGSSSPSWIVCFPHHWYPGTALYLLASFGHEISVWHPQNGGKAKIEKIWNKENTHGVDLLLFPRDDAASLILLGPDGVSHLQRSEDSKLSLTFDREHVFSTLRRGAESFIEDGWLFVRASDGSLMRRCWIPYHKRPSQLYATSSPGRIHVWKTEKGDTVIIDTGEISIAQ